MAIMEISVETSKQSMDEIRPALDAALAKQFPGGALKLVWNGDVLELTAMGSKGSIVFEGGQLIGKADLKPPASMMRPMIEQKMKTAFAEAAG